MWVACQTNRLHDAKAHTDRTPRPFIWRAHSRIELKTCVRRSRHDDHGVIRSNNLFRVYFPDSAGVSFVSPIGAAYTPCLCAAKETGFRELFDDSSRENAPNISQPPQLRQRSSASGRCSAISRIG